MILALQQARACYLGCCWAVARTRQVRQDESPTRLVKRSQENSRASVRHPSLHVQLLARLTSAQSVGSFTAPLVSLPQCISSKLSHNN